MPQRRVSYVKNGCLADGFAVLGIATHGLKFVALLRFGTGENGGEAQSD
jgi:hypothetical protein